MEMPVSLNVIGHDGHIFSVDADATIYYEVGTYDGESSILVHKAPLSNATINGEVLSYADIRDWCNKYFYDYKVSLECLVMLASDFHEA